jgi:hypothetical protein
LRAPIVLLGLTLVTMAFVSGGPALWGSATPTEADGANVISLDAVSGGPIDTTRAVTSTNPFDVDIYVQHGGIESLNYSWFEAVLCFDSGVLDFAPSADLDHDTTAESWMYTELGEMHAHTGVLEGLAPCPAQFPDRQLYGGSARYAGRTSASGVGATATFRCVGSGTATLHLVTQAENPIFSTTGVPSGEALPTTLADAEITCSLPPTETPCPPDVCTPTATPPPAPTPTATPTPDPSARPNLMSVDAVSGGDIDATRQVAAGSEFDVDIHIQHGGSSGLEYAGYGAGVCFDSDILNFVPTQDMNDDTIPESWTYTGLGQMYIEGSVTAGGVRCPADLADTGLYGGAIRPAGTGTTSASGAAVTARFACVDAGVTTIHLATQEEDADFYSMTMELSAAALPTDLADATITCLPDTDGDRCADLREFLMGFHPIDPSDFFSVPAPAQPDTDPNGPKDEVVTMKDVLAVLWYVGTFEGDGGSPNTNGVAYDTVKGSCPVPFADGATQREGLCYDRSPSPAPNPPWDAGPPNGAVNMSDVLAVLAQVGLDCGEEL